MKTERIIDRIEKLLRLATSSNAGEAATAAARAQALMDEYRIDRELIAERQSSRVAMDLEDESVVDFGSKEAPLDDAKRVERWKAWLASILAKHNGCFVYTQRVYRFPRTLIGTHVQIVGRPSDAEAVRYLYGYLVREIDRLADQHGKGCGRTWRNNFRIGAVDAIEDQLNLQREASRQKAYADAQSTGMALVVVDRALERIDRRRSEAEAHARATQDLQKRGAGRVAGDESARAVGRREGAKIQLNRAKGGLSAPKKAIGGAQ